VQIGKKIYWQECAESGFRQGFGSNLGERRLIEILEVFAAAITQPDKNDRNKQD
jgi:hypothetical protein